MTRKHLPLSLLLVGVLVVGSFDAGLHAQTPIRAEIKQIALQISDSKIKLVNRTNRAGFKREKQSTWQMATKKAKLYQNDEVFVRNDAFLRLQLKGEKASARVTLWGDSSGHDLAGGSYIMREKPERQNIVEFFINYGSFVFAGKADELQAKSAALDVRHHGTRYLMRVDRATGRTVVFVDDGEVTVSGVQTSLRLREQEGAWALPGGEPQRIALTAAALNTLKATVHQHYSEIWASAWWKSPFLLGGAAAAAGGAVALIVNNGGESDNTATGTISVSW